MEIKNTVRYLASAALLATTCSFANAESNSGFYAGSGAGIYYVDFDDVSFDESAATVRVFGGYKLNEYVAFEAGYMKLFEASGDTLGVDIEMDGTSWDVSVRPTLPVGDRFDVFGIVGWTQYDFEVKASALGVSTSDSDKNDDLIYGLGGAFNLNDNWTLRGEWVAIDVDDADFGTLTFSATYNFR
jgi:opacity protein-like surface antigen